MKTAMAAYREKILTAGIVVRAAVEINKEKSTSNSVYYLAQILLECNDLKISF
jgi:hypothetical protein